ncbi:MAG: hypothetical protein HeimC3_07740 [Candidatus Heimdallarchaeota archaeon LC_3]|nr:MAG: hypothetical protein HeimC3_07740 [Candidatus Heimdallarchaeota archaeon LC_3]
MSIQQKIRNGKVSYKSFIYGILPILIISGSILTYQVYMSDSVEEQELSEELFLSNKILDEPYLMNQPLLEQYQKKSNIPDSLLQYLSDEDRMKLEEYDEYLSEFSDSDLKAFQMYEEKLKQLSYPDQSSLKVYDYFVNQVDPRELTKNISSDDLPNFQESLESFFFQDWTNSPSDSLLDNASENLESVTKQDEQYIETINQVAEEDYQVIDKTLITANQEIFTRTVITDNWNMTERTEINGKPRIKLIEADFSGFDNFTIPITHKIDETTTEQVIKSADEVEWITKTINAKIGFEFDVPGFNHQLDLELFIIRFRAWAIFETGFHLVFPVKLIIEYPAQVVEGAEYSLKVTLEPIDLPDYDEFLIKFILDIGVGLDVLLPKITIKWIPIWIWWWGWKLIKIPVPILSFFWFPIFNFPIVDYSFKLNNSYATPLAGDSVNIDLGLDLDLLPIIAKLKIPYVSAICDALSKVMEVGVGLGFLEVIGNAVTGHLKVSAGKTLTTENSVSWTESGDINTLNFRVPSSGEDYLSLYVSNLVFHASNVLWTPEFFIKFKDVDIGKILLEYQVNKELELEDDEEFELPDSIPDGLLIIPLNKWWGEHRFPIFQFPLGEQHVPGLYWYGIKTSTIADTDVYDFTMDIEERIVKTMTFNQGSFATVQTFDKVYEITLQNTGGSTDVVELQVQDLPQGYTATFDRTVPQYEISNSPTMVNLIISPPKNIDLPPGESNFSVKATSQGKRNLLLANDSLIQSVTLKIPEITDLSLELDLPTEKFEVIQIDPHMVMSIEFYGGNLGNLKDNITVTGRLYSAETYLKTWEQNFSVDPYGSGSSQYYNDEFTFNYSKSDLFPTPGLYTLDIIASSQKSSSIVKIQRRILNFTKFYDLETSISPVSTTLFANYGHNFTLNITNIGNARTNFSLISDGWDQYLDFPSQILNVEPQETREILVELYITDPQNVPAKDYTFRILSIADGSGDKVHSTEIVDVTVLDPDFVAPDITYIPHYEFPSGLIIPQSSLTFKLEWEAFDDYPNIYSIYIDDVVYQTGSWDNNTPTQVPVTGINPLVVGNHNITIAFTDLVGNIASDQVLVTIVSADVTDPLIVPVTNAFSVPQNFNFSHYLIWNCTEEFLFNATIYLNGTELSLENLYIQEYPNENNKFYAKFGILPGSLAEGIWNFTFIVQDMNDNSASSTIYVSVTPIDSNFPQLTTLPNSLAYLMRGDTLNFTATDSYPDRFELWRNSSLLENATWQSGVQVILNVDELDLFIGANYLELYLYDLSKHVTYHQWIFNYRDIDTPSLLEEPSDFTVYEHNYTDTVFPQWKIHDFDYHPGTYTIFLDSTLLKEGNWTNGNPIISLPREYLLPGIHLFEAYFRDASGNTIFSSVEVTVLDILEPFIWPRNAIRYEPLYTASWFEFFVSESHLSSYTLFKDGLKTIEGAISNDFPFLFVDISTLSPGQYIYTLEVLDESGNLGVESISVTVSDSNPPFIKRPFDLVYSEGTTGHSVTWEIFEAYPKSYSLYLDNQLIDSSISVETNFSVSVDSLSLGLHEYILVVYDEGGLSYSSLIYVAVVDITAPSLSHISDCQFVFEDPNAELIWKVYDLHPASYTLKLNDNIIRESEWTTETSIKFSFTGWPEGIHNIELIITDTSGNTISDEVIVNLIENEVITSITTQSLQQTPGFEFLLVLFSFILINYRFRRKKLEENID